MMRARRYRAQHRLSDTQENGQGWMADDSVDRGRDAHEVD